MSRKGDNAYVLACGCRFFEGEASMCEQHRFDRNQARWDGAMATFLIACVAGFFLSLMCFGGCAVGHLEEVPGVDSSSDAVLSRGDSGNRNMDSGVVADTSIPEAPDAVDADGGGPDGYPDASDAADSGVESHPPRCPAVVPIDGCMGGTLNYPTGDIVCCIPVDWEGYRVHCPQPREGCRWGYGSFDGWIGECCA